MVKKKLKPFVIPMFFVLLVSAFALITFTISKMLISSNVDEDYLYVSYEVLLDNSVPVIGVSEDKIIRPYTDETVKIGKTFYDYKSEDEQNSSIVFFENTYIQNLGIDYISENVFNIVSSFNGTVISVTEDDITGKTIKVRYNEDIIATYQSLSETYVKENDKVGKGEIIGKSGTNEIGSDLGNHLHFELFLKGNLVNPEEYYDKNIGEI